MESLTARFHKEVFLPYLELLKAQYRIHPAFQHARQIWEAKLTEQELVNGPYLEKAHIYAPGEPFESLPLHTSTVKTIRSFRPNLWKHQTDALKLLLTGNNAVIATGTSSGKTLCYQIPILDDLIRNPSEGLRAVIIYPLNALVNDQLAEWERILQGHPQITFARFTGQTPDSPLEYVARLRDSFRRQLGDEKFTRQQLDQEVERRVQQQIKADPPNRLNHRVAIRANPPNILITNFSMLEYLLERPVDAPIFENTRLKFLVLDEAHAYRGVQATEIAFLIRRLKDRLALEKLTCVATSATLGEKGDTDSRRKVRQFAGDLFHEPFGDDNPIYGEAMEPVLAKPSFRPTPGQYTQVAEVLRNNPATDVRPVFGVTLPEKQLADLLAHDENLYRLRATLTTATRLDKAVATLWPDDSKAEGGLQALLQIVGLAQKNASHDDLFPTRLHYFVRAQDGLHVCLHKECPDRRGKEAAFFVSRQTASDVPEGNCPACYRTNRTSKLVEVATCRKCGYLFGALQDLGPRHAQNPDSEGDRSDIDFDSFSTELGWASDSYWSYFSVEEELPYPSQPKLDEEEEDQTDLFLNPARLNWCVLCGKRNDKGAGDTCGCLQPHLREIKVFHRQCPHSGKPKDRDNLTNPEKRPLTSCPNCGARNSSGLEPLRRFQESDDETGIALAIPLAHFQVTPRNDQARLPRKLLCFTDNRQRAAAFPSLLEEETFSHDMGRHIVRIVCEGGRPVDLVKLGEQLAEVSDSSSDKFDPDFFLPVSRFPDEELNAKGKRDLWVAETFAYFGIPDSARESAEDLGLVAVEYRLKDNERAAFHRVLGIADLSSSDADAALQTLAAFMRHRKAFTLPKGRVEPHALAFGRITADIGFVKRREGIRNTEGWLPRKNKDGSYRHNFITDYLRRMAGLTPEQTLSLAERIWDYLTDRSLAVLVDDKGTWKLDHERLFATKPASRYVCSRCGIVTPYSALQVCPRKECDGKLEHRSFDPTQANIVARWVAGTHTAKFTTLKSEEHTAQISKDVAKIIEEDFRAAGVNLLSSTTTFEMGINIGDLQKILLRNAPPTSANYVQRVGRSGRGEDKNAICVTLCRRTKYDADAWSNPPRLMSGEVRPPTVFTKNPVIARRHFNATVFAQFLRVKIKNERVLGDIRQNIRLEGFIPLDSRKGIPAKWLRIPSPDLFLDFYQWLNNQSEATIFKTTPGRSILDATDGFENGRMSSLKSYKEILDTITDELRVLMTERQKLFGEGGSTYETEKAIKDMLDSNVIDVLAKRGFLPRYAFPLDLVTLETGWSRWSRDVDVELSRDRGLAIAEFAPGAQVIAHKKVFTSAGLYVVSKADEPQRLWFSKCRGCEQIRTGATDNQLIVECAVCHQTITRQNVRPFVKPEAFSVRIEKGDQGIARHRRGTLVRQRQSLTHFIDYVEPDSLHDLGLFRVALKERGRLFRYNLGPGNKGFRLCPKCGSSEPLSGFKVGKRHKKLRVLSGSSQCENDSLWGDSNKPLAFGHEFETFSLIARPVVPVKSIESLTFALQKGLCRQLELESNDIGVSWRWVAKRSDGAGAEVILYDRTPGGAGFVKEGFSSWQAVVKKTYEICAECDCEKACYECLKDYGNQGYHGKLDRDSVKALLGG
ncbi:MAG: helicase [Nitrospira sp.]